MEDFIKSYFDTKVWKETEGCTRITTFDLKAKLLSYNLIYQLSKKGLTFKNLTAVMKKSTNSLKNLKINNHS